MRKYDVKDLDHINAWNSERKDPLFTPGDLPKNGMIEPDVAAGFLFKTDSEIAILENFVSNPNATPFDVSKAIDKIVEELEQTAKAFGYFKLAAFTHVRSIGSRLERLGFKPRGEWSGYAREVK